MKAIVLGGLALIMAAFGLSAAYASQSRRRNVHRRDHGNGGPGVFGGDTGLDGGSGDATGCGDGDGDGDGGD